jgi:hypothetical protein
MSLTLATVLLSCLLALAWTQVPKLWTHHTKYWDGRAPGWWVWGEAAYRGWVRALVIMTVAGTAMVLTVAVGLLLGLDADDSSVEDASTAVAVTIAVLIGVTVVLFLTAVSVILFNRPRTVVPPHLRAESGAIHLWFRRKRAR